jgi:hypothetical protein
MTATLLVTEVGRRGIELWVEGNWLCFRPETAVTPGLRSQLRLHKGAIIKLLRGHTVPRRGVAGELVIPLKSDEQFQWWTARTWEEVERRFRVARIAAGLPSNGMDS